MSHVAGFLPPPTVRAYRQAHRAAATLSERRVLDELERCERKYGRATPSVIGMAERLHIGARTVVRVTRRLRDEGRLRVFPGKVHKRPDGTFHRTMTNLYRVTFPARNTRSHRQATGGPPIGMNTHPDAAGGAAVAQPPPPAPPPTPEPAPPLPLDAPLTDDPTARRTFAAATWRAAAAAERAARTGAPKGTAG